MSSDSRSKWREDNSQYLSEYRRRKYDAAKASRAHARRKYLKTERGKESEKLFSAKAKLKYLSVPKNRIRMLLTHAFKRAARKGMPMDVGLYETLTVNLPDTCACCNVRLDYTSGRGHADRDASPSLDRVNNNGGYTSDNVVIICTRCNLLKSHVLLADIDNIRAYISNFGNETARAARSEARSALLLDITDLKQRESELKALNEPVKTKHVQITASERVERRQKLKEEHRAWWADKSQEDRKRHAANAIAVREKNRNLDWSGVDWSDFSSNIAKDLGVSVAAVIRKRRRVGAPPSPRGSRTPHNAITSK